jgi:hypothetical protein
LTAIFGYDALKRLVQLLLEHKRAVADPACVDQLPQLRKQLKSRRPSRSSLN